MDARTLINKRFSTVVFLCCLKAGNVTADMQLLLAKEYLSTRQTFFINRLTAVSAAHFDVNTTILGQRVQN